MCSTILPCPLCRQPNFQSIDSLRISLVNVTNRPLECPICCDVLYGLDKLTIHLFSHSLNQENSVETKYDKNLSNVDLLPQANGSCETKIESFCNENKQNHSHESCLNTEHKEQSSSKTVEPQCDICGSSFRTVELHRLHLKLVHEISDEAIQRAESVIGEKALKNCFPCHLCSKVFKMKGSLRVHLKVVHSFGKAGRVPILDGFQQTTVLSKNATESYGTDGLYNAENKLNNVEVKAWECDACAKTFTTKYFLKKHKRLHTGLKTTQVFIIAVRFYIDFDFQEKCLIHASYVVRSVENYYS